MPKKKTRLSPTTVRLSSVDSENVDVIVRSGFGSDLAHAVRFALAIARRWIDEGRRIAS